MLDNIQHFYWCLKKAKQTRWVSPMIVPAFWLEGITEWESVRWCQIDQQSCWVEKAGIKVRKVKAAIICGTECPRERRCLEKTLKCFYQGSSWVFSWIPTCSCIEWNPTKQIIKTQGKKHYCGTVSQIILRDHTELDIIIDPYGRHLVKYTEQSVEIREELCHKR